MKSFFKELFRRNELLFYLSTGLSLLFMIFLVLFTICQFQLYKICDWLKPFKFSLSFAVYAASLGWYLEYLKTFRSKSWIKGVSWLVLIFILIEMGIIFTQSLTTDGFSSKTLYHLANLFIIANLAVASYIAVQFFHKIPLKPTSYLWAIRVGFITLILSGLLGVFLVGWYGQVQLNPNQYGIPLTQFSSIRDNLVSLHFIGIHCLQLLPLCCYYLQKQKQSQNVN